MTRVVVGLLGNTLVAIVVWWAPDWVDDGHGHVASGVASVKQEQTASVYLPHVIEGVSASGERGRVPPSQRTREPAGQLPPATATPMHKPGISPLVNAGCIVSSTVSLAGGPFTLTEVRTYNHESRPLLVKDFVQGRVGKTTRFGYLADGIRIKTRSVDNDGNGDYEIRIDYEYDEVGRIQGFVSYLQGEIRDRGRLQYRDAVLRSIDVEKFLPRTGTRRTQYDYDAEGRLTRISRFVNGELDQSTAYGWRGRWLATETRVIWPDTGDATHTDFTYGPYGWLEESRIYDVSQEWGRVLIGMEQYEYTLEGWLVRLEVRTYKRTDVLTYEYDENGRLGVELYESDHYPSQRREFDVDCRQERAR